MTLLSESDLATVTGGLSNGVKCAIGTAAGALGLGSAAKLAGPVIPLPKTFTVINALVGAEAGYDLTPACHANG